MCESDARSEKDVTAIAHFPSHVRFASAFRALLFGPCGTFGCVGFALSFRFQFLGPSCVRLMNRALRVDAALRIGLLPAYRADFAARLRNPGSGLLFAHPATPPAMRAHRRTTPERTDARSTRNRHTHSTSDRLPNDARRSKRPIRHSVWGNNDRDPASVSFLVMT